MIKIIVFNSSNYLFYQKSIKMEIPQSISFKEDVFIPIGNINLEGSLNIPDEASGLVIFSHGSGSSRFSSRNNMVAECLRRNGLGTLLFDLLNLQEDTVYKNRFDIDLLTKRLVAATGWVMEQPESKKLPVGYFGASTGAASALNAAAELSHTIKAVVSRGGRPDLSIPVLQKVKAPVLLLVGELDNEVIRLNEHAYEKIQATKKLIIIPGATHLFEEHGKLELVAKYSCDWFLNYLS
jgi:putative phosphoribosyl transferase